MKDYKELRKAIKNKNAGEDFDEVNKRIENIISPISDKSGKIKIIKSLICRFEGKLNKVAFYSLAAISYALEIGAISVISNMENITDHPIFIIVLVMVGIAVVLIIAGVVYSKKDGKDTFILKAFYFKLDELNNKDESSAKTGKTSESGTENEADIANGLDEEKNKKYTPYNFDEEIEYKIYNNIRERYNRKFLGKKTKVHKEYPGFNKYTEWETYFKNKFLTEISDKCEFKYYLNDRLRVYQGLEDISKSVVTPIYIAVITLVLTIYSTIGLSFIVLICSLLVGMILIMISLMCIIWEHGRKVNFYEDCINILEQEDTSHQ